MSDTETPAAEAAPAAAAGPKPIVLIAGVVIGLALGGATGALVVGPKLAAGMAPAGAAAHGAKSGAHAGDAESDEEADADGESEDEGDGDEEGSKGKEGEHGAGESAVHVIDNLVLNPAASNGTRFLLLTVAFDMKTAALAEQVKVRDAEVRDAVLAVVGAKTVEELAVPATRDSLKGELRTVVGKLVKKKSGVRRIYFPQFVIQ